MMRTFHIDIALCFADRGDWDLENSKFNSTPDWGSVEQALLHLHPDSGDQIPAPMITVQVLLSKDHLPNGLRSTAMRPDQVFQTDLMMDITADKVLAVWRLMPNALHQHGGLLNMGANEYLSTSFDRCVVGHMDFVTTAGASGGLRGRGSGSLIEASEQGLSSTAILNSLHKGSSVQVLIMIYRVTPLPVHLVLPTIACSSRLFGLPRPGLSVYQVAVSNSLLSWVKGKAKLTYNTSADNTIRLNIPGYTIALILHDLVPWDASLKMQNVVSLDEGLLKVELPDFPSAKGLLGRENGLFDFTPYGYGFVELFAPITVKWEMYDTTRDLADSRAVDGFVAITFASYVERDRSNNTVIKSTKRHRKSHSQLDKRPATCD